MMIKYVAALLRCGGLKLEENSVDFMFFHNNREPKSELTNKERALALGLKI